MRMAALIARFVDLSAPEEKAFERFARPALRSWNGIEVGSLRPVGLLRSPS